MKLITKRMTVMTLDPAQMKLLGSDIPALEKDLTIQYNLGPVEPNTREYIKNKARLCAEDEDNYLWHTFWMFHLDRELIGYIYFKNVPDSWGRVEIGFHINNFYKNQGLTTEAVEKVTNWALTRGDAKCITAEINKNNTASQRVLEKSGFESHKETENYYYYKKEHVKEAESWISQFLTEKHGPGK